MNALTPRRRGAWIAVLCTVVLLAAALPRSVAREAEPPAPSARGGLAHAIEAQVRGMRPVPGLSARAWGAVSRLYERHDYEPRWMDGKRPGPGARALVQALAQAGHEGLRASDYPVGRLTQALERVRADADPAPEHVARADVAFTAVFAAWAEDLWAGRFDPAAVEADWHIRPEAADFAAVLESALQPGTLEQALERLRPQGTGYPALVEELARYRDLAQRGGWPEIPAGELLQQGDAGERVATLRERLRIENYLPSSDAQAGGWDPQRFDAPLADAVARFQDRHGLAVDRMVGPVTLAALNVPAARRVLQIEANLERYRWLPRNLGARHVVVNIPAFQLDAFEEGRRVLSMAVVVGSELDERATPVFADTIAYLQFAPYWNVPARIAREEILPDAKGDPAWLVRRGFEVVQGWGEYESVVDVRTLRAEDLEPKAFRYRLRQPPGPDNPLGRVKFIFPNDFAVYLHDTPREDLLERRVRAFSHGCVRVAEPAALAEFVLAGNPGWDAERIHETLETGERARVHPDKTVGVYLLYLTAFVRDGELQFRNDLYQMDAGLMRAFAREADSHAAAEADPITQLRDMVGAS